ncbi:transcriptional regulator [Pseudomonas sp. PIC25]|uniref:helix-turn-helix domain-containing protein n=1 Tax=Pseudomonas sp. PIC25 TaxID=1958773 RepID=UPI000BABE0DF|nr:helix-turn-helix domain-containing protein [Pseudomonas sp. PIC25]PAU55290.1 transcriptional regulator [Pseudomonas sp. PIC25]
MDYQLINERFGAEIRQLRLKRGLTQAELAGMAGITRQKLIEVEKGHGTVALNFYTRVIASLEGELQVVPAQLPTLDDIRGLFG